VKKYIALCIFCILFLFVSSGYAADIKITELTEDTAPSSDDLLVTVDAPGGSAATKKATIANVMKQYLVPGGTSNIQTWTGNFSFGATLTGNTTVTFPTTGKLLSLNGTMTDEQLLCGENTGGVDQVKSCGARTIDNSEASHFLYKDADGHVENATVTGTGTTMVLSESPTIATPLATLARVDGHTSISPLSAAQVSGTIIRNTGQALADVNHTLPQAAAGYNFIGYVGTALAATNYYRFTADASPQDYICLDGTCGKTYVTIDTPTIGATITCYTEQVSGTGLKNEADLGIGTSANTAVKNTVAVEFDIAGTGYSKAVAETAPGNDTIPQNRYGAVAFEIGADGTIDAIEASANATGYDSAALAIAGIPAVEAAHTRLGTVTAMSTEAGGFVFGTTALNAANTTVAYTDATVYTPSFAWICITGKGTWVTD
jgi:hypothetical protein